MDLDTTKQLLIDAFEAMGIVKVTAAYSGSGDSGQMDEIVALGPNGDDDVIDLDKLPPELAEHESVRKMTAALLGQDGKKTLPELIEEFTWAAVDNFGHAGFENNDGGDGTLTVNVTEGTVELDHNDYYTESNNSVHEL